MREYLKPVDICNEISMMRDSFDGPIIVVEGITDLRLYGKFTDREGAEFVVGHSKDNVKAVVRETYAVRKDKKVIGILDADLDYMYGRSREPPLFLTDSRDNETMLIRSGSLERILWEYADETRLERFEEDRGKVVDAVAEAAFPLGMLMYVSDRLSMGLCFKDLEFERFIDRRTLAVDVKAMINEIIYNTNAPNRSVRSIRHALENGKRTDLDPWKVCRGHDSVAILAIGLRYIFGGANSRGIRTGELSGALRLAYTADDFMKTELYKDVREWSESHGFDVWKLTVS